MNSPDAADERCAAVLRAHGAREAEIEELLRYNENPLIAQIGRLPSQLPLADEPFVTAWADYAAEAAASDDARAVWTTLRRRLIQLRFPIAAGQSQNDEYRAATLGGNWPPEERPGLHLQRPELLTLQLQPTAAGRLPILFTPHRPDFETLVQALARRNEPQPVPASMGACFVAGYNNWDRLARLRAEWAQRQPVGVDDEAAWQEEFARIRPQKPLYQDAFMLLSGGPYSAVSAAALGVPDEAEWGRLSVIIRREHECAHYVTRRIFGVLSGRLYEELLADFVGLAAALGHYRADWALRFLGLEDFPRYRSGGRLENYRERAPLPPLSDGAFAVLGALVHRAARQLEAILAASRADLSQAAERTHWLLALSTLTLADLASADAAALLEHARAEVVPAPRLHSTAA